MRLLDVPSYVCGVTLGILSQNIICFMPKPNQTVRTVLSQGKIENRM